MTNYNIPKYRLDVNTCRACHAAGQTCTHDSGTYSMQCWDGSIHHGGCNVSRGCQCPCHHTKCSDEFCLNNATGPDGLCDQDRLHRRQRGGRVLAAPSEAEVQAAIQSILDAGKDR